MNRVGGALLVLAERHKMKAFDIYDKYWLDVDDDNALKNAKSLLFENLRKNTDGPISTILNRPISSKISELLLKTNITPNQISLSVFSVRYFFLMEIISLWSSEEF